MSTTHDARSTAASGCAVWRHRLSSEPRRALQVLECAKQLIKGHVSLRRAESPSESCAPVHLMQNLATQSSCWVHLAIAGDGVEVLTRGTKEVQWKGQHLHSIQRLV